MKAKISKTSVTFTNISNENLLDDIVCNSIHSKCSYEQFNHSTKVVVSGNEKQIKDFIEAYNS